MNNTIQMQVNDTAAQWLSIVDIQTQDANSKCTTLGSYFRSLAGGTQEAVMQVYVDSVKAAGTLTFSGLPTADQTCAILGVTFTAKASASTAVQFTIGLNAVASATNLAAKINAYTAFAGVITAVATTDESNDGIVTITAYTPGIGGNFLPLSAGNLSNCVAVGFAGGTAGTLITIDRS